METLRKQKLREFKESWTLCAHCGTCNARAPIIPHNWRELPPPEWSAPYRRCPSFEYYNYRAYTAQGRNVLATLFFDDAHYPITEDLLKIVYTCTSCGVCSDICKATDPLTAVWAWREELTARGAQLPEPLEQIHQRIQDSGNMFGAKQAIQRNDLPQAGKDVFFAGCNVRFAQPQVIDAVAKTLHKAGIDIAYLGDHEICCGFIPGYDGNTDLMERQAQLNVENLRQAGCQRVIVSCAHCYRALSVDYSLLVGPLPFEVVHYADLLAQLLEDKKLAFRESSPAQVTYHDPCFLGRFGQIYDAPRTVIQSIPGVELVEMERNRRWSYCCGSGAKISAACYPEFGGAISKDRIAEGLRAAGTIVTACTTCVHQLTRAARNEGIDVAVKDLSVLAAERLA
ncbi:MAG: (Fe-S)-binding protein [Peptococcaceae bacterium]|jgi:Fe-S oxidoreductase|nr:(Fe-S)-binding protein [Peptococcaceae bacterium]